MSLKIANKPYKKKQFFSQKGPIIKDGIVFFIREKYIQASFNLKRIFSHVLLKKLECRHFSLG